jgi:glycolate oxidase FAD binding subunit
MSGRIVGLGTKQWLLAPPEEGAVEVRAPSGILDFWPADQVVSVQAGTPLDELQSALGERGQCLPLPDARTHGACLAGWPGTLGGLVAANLPHGLLRDCGGPRDWVLGSTVVRADGTRAKSGSRAVKSVAGFDVHRALVGSWGQLALVESVILRTWPLAAVPACSGTVVGPLHPPEAWTLRTDRLHFSEALERAPKVLAYDEPSCTIWCADEPVAPSVGWLLGPGGRRWSGQPVHPFGARLKEVLDPEGAFV